MPNYDDIYNNFRWEVPECFNIGAAVCDVHAEATPDKEALIYEDESGLVMRYTFKDIKRLSDTFANALRGLGMKKGDRFAIFLSQQVETLIAHLAGFKLGLINIPLFTLFGPEALEYRLNNCGAKAMILDAGNLEKIIEIRPRLTCLEKIIVTGNYPAGTGEFAGYEKVMAAASDAFTPVNTMADDPAIIIYTSGTTGSPKGALHAHRVLLGHMPGVELPHNFFPQKGDLFWTPADWAWIGGLFDVLFPSLYHGIPVFAKRLKKFDPETALRIMEKHRIRNVFMPPTALKMLRTIKNIKSKHSLSLRTVASGGEPLGEETLSWGREELNIGINEFYGQTEANLLVTNCSAVMDIRPGSMGKAVPGQRVGVIDDKGNELPRGEEGEIAVKKGTPVMFLNYWKNEQGTSEKFTGDWMRTGDMGRRDEDGYFWFGGRNDDVISSAGYRIGPSEIEDCLLKHPAVSLSAVIGKPDTMRGEIVKAFIVLRDNVSETSGLKSEIKEFVKNKLAAHEYPREIEFVKELPMTITGKIMRRELRKLELERMKADGN